MNHCRGCGNSFRACVCKDNIVQPTLEARVERLEKQLDRLADIWLTVTAKWIDSMIAMGERIRVAEENRRKR